VDLTQSALIACAERLGMQVEITRLPVDAWVAIRGVWYPVEFKSKNGKYTRAQMDFKARCQANRTPFLTWRTEQDVMDALM
jgi:hypothetical protein